MNQKDFDDAMKWLEFADTRNWGPGLEFTLWGLDDDLEELTPEQEKNLKNRLLECRDNIVGEYDGWRRILDVRKYYKIPKNRFWWYIDKL